MRSLICFAFLMSASICMLTVTPVQVSADGDTDNLTASLTGTSDIVFADSKKKPAKTEGDEVKKKTKEQIALEKDEYDKRIDDVQTAINVANRLIAKIQKEIADLEEMESTADLVALGYPDRADYESEEDWLLATIRWFGSIRATAEERAEWINRWNKAKEVTKRLKNLKKRLKALKTSVVEFLIDKTSIEKEKEIHCKKYGDG